MANFGRLLLVHVIINHLIRIQIDKANSVSADSDRQVSCIVRLERFLSIF